MEEALTDLVGQTITAKVEAIVLVEAIALVAGHQVVALLLGAVVSHMVAELLLEEVVIMVEAVVDIINQAVLALPTVPLQVAHPLALPLDLVSIFKEE